MYFKMYLCLIFSKETDLEKIREILYESLPRKTYTRYNSSYDYLIKTIVSILESNKLDSNMDYKYIENSLENSIVIPLEGHYTSCVYVEDGVGWCTPLHMTLNI